MYPDVINRQPPDPSEALDAKNPHYPPNKGRTGPLSAYDPAEMYLSDAQVEQRWDAAGGYMSEFARPGARES